MACQKTDSRLPGLADVTCAVTLLIMQELLDLGSWIALVAITRELRAAQASVRDILSLPEAAQGDAFDVALDLSKLKDSFEYRVSAPQCGREACAKGHTRMQVDGCMVEGEAAQGTRDAPSACAWVLFLLSCAWPLWMPSGLPTYVFCCLMPANWIDVAGAAPASH